MELQQQHDESTFVQNISFNTTIVEFRTDILKAPNLNIDNILCSDLEVDDHGKAKGVRKLPFHQLGSNQLRIICSRLGIKGVKNEKRRR
jgi:hypothetical protein